MRHTYMILGLFVIVMNMLIESAFALTCPASPQQLSHDIKIETEAKASALGKLGGAELKNKTAIEAKNLFEKVNSGERVYVAQMLVSVFCQVIAESKELTDKEKLDRFERFQTQIMGLLNPEQPTKLKKTIKPRRETEIRFKAILKSVTSIPLPGNKVDLAMTWSLQPSINDNMKAVNIIYGLVRLYNDELWKDADLTTGPKRCEEVPSCLGYKLWDRHQNPITISGSSAGSELTWIKKIPDTASVVRIDWEFWQREADNGGKCQLDKPNPTGGIPFLTVVSPSGKNIGPLCYFSRDLAIFPIPKGKE